MLGATITLNIGTVADPIEITLRRINQDGYSSEYRLKDTDREHVLLIRHSKEKNRLKGKEVERHNVTYTQNLFPSELSPQGETIQASAVFRNAPERASDDVVSVMNAVSGFMTTNAAALAGWDN